MNSLTKIALAVVLAATLAGCKNVEIITEITEKTFDQDGKVVSEKTTHNTQTDESFTFGFSEGDNKQINIVPLDISVIK